MLRSLPTGQTLQPRQRTILDQAEARFRNVLNFVAAGKLHTSLKFVVERIQHETDTVFPVILRPPGEQGRSISPQR